MHLCYTHLELPRKSMERMPNTSRWRLKRLQMPTPKTRRGSSCKTKVELPRPPVANGPRDLQLTKDGVSDGPYPLPPSRLALAPSNHPFTSSQHTLWRQWLHLPKPPPLPWKNPKRNILHGKLHDFENKKKPSWLQLRWRAMVLPSPKRLYSTRLCNYGQLCSYALSVCCMSCRDAVPPRT